MDKETTTLGCITALVMMSLSIAITLALIGGSVWVVVWVLQSMGVL